MRAEKSRPGEKAALPQVIAATETHPTTARRQLPGLTPEQAHIWHLWLADAYGVEGDRLAYVALVETPSGKYRRRVFLSLASALAAVERADARHQDARVILAELRALGGAL